MKSLKVKELKSEDDGVFNSRRDKMMFLLNK